MAANGMPLRIRTTGQTLPFVVAVEISGELPFASTHPSSDDDGSAACSDRARAAVVMRSSICAKNGLRTANLVRRTIFKEVPSIHLIALILNNDLIHVGPMSIVRCCIAHVC